MSFSDVERRRLNRTHREEQSSFSKRQPPKAAPPTLRYFYGGTSDQATLEPSPQVKEDLSRTTPQRGVRPHLSNVCPVTQKPLMIMDAAREEDASTVTSFSYGFDDAADDDSFPAPVTTSRPRQADSEYAMLNKEIVNFQKMVADLEQAMEKSAESPEAQWKTRILLRSVQEAQQDIHNRLLDFQDACHRRRDNRGQMALRKLKRDFARIQDQFKEVSQSHLRKQQAEVSLFHSRKDEEEEEFFDRAMREREQEVNGIHQSMRTVNAIYKDLAEMVDGQQEKIDKLSDQVEESKYNTRYGLEQIQEAVMGMCAPLDGDSSSGAAGSCSNAWSDAMEDVFELATSCKTEVEEGLCTSDESVTY